MDVFESAMRRSFIILFFFMEIIEYKIAPVAQKRSIFIVSVPFHFLATSLVLLFDPYCVVKQLIEPQVLIMESMYRLYLLPLG